MYRSFESITNWQRCDICNSRGEYAHYPWVRRLLAKGDIGMNKQIASEGSVSQLNNGIASPGQIKGSNDFASSVSGASE